MGLFLSKRKRSALRAAFFCALLAGGARADETGDLAELSQQARRLMAEGRFAQAIPICERLVKALPGNPGLMLNLGLAEQMAGHPDRAIPRLEEVLKSQPDSVPALTLLARAELQLDRPKAAIPPLQRLMRIEPSNREVGGMLAGALLDSGELAEAAAEYRKLTAAFPEDSKAWYGLGKTYQAQSARLYDRLTKDNPQSGYVAALIGALRLKDQQYHSAFFFYKEAARQMPSLRGVHSGLAMIYRKAGHADWAALEEKKEDGIPLPDCSRDSPECYFVQNRYADAARAAADSHDEAGLYWGIKAYDQLALAVFARLEALPDSVEKHALRAQLAHGRNQEVEAVSEWRAALKLAPGNSRIEGELTTSLFLAHDYAAAIPRIEKLLSADEKSADLNFMLGESLLRTEQPEKALAYLEKALRTNPAMLPAHASAGLALAKLNRNAEAIPHLEKALELDDDGALHYQLARAYQQTGNAARASELMAQYQEIQKRNQAEKAAVTADVAITGPE